MNYKSEWVCETTKGEILKGIILRGIIFRRIALRTLLLNKLFLLAVLVSCSEETSRAQLQPPTTPPVIPANPIVGTAVLGLVSNARVDAYLIATESQAQQHKECSTDSKNKIGSGATDNNGYFNLTLNLNSGYVLFVLSGGSYTEEATNQQVYLTDNQKLYAVHHYHGRETKDQEEIENIIISPWSHLMTGMFCYMTGSRGRSSASSPAISPANSMINTSAFITNWLGFDPRYVNYKDPTDAKNNRADLTFDEGVKLGFLNSAISELTKEWSATDEVTPHATINSIYLAQLMYEDINNDGSLDGRGAKGPLHIVRKVSNVPLNAATYRLSIPQQMLNFFDSNENNQIKDNGRGILYLLADSINSNKHPQVFQQQKSPPLDMLAPQVEWIAPNTKRLTGAVNISLRVKDFSGVEQVTFYATSSRAASQNREQAIDDTYTFVVDTRPDGSGDFDYRVTTVDILGNEQTINFPVTLINEPPIIEIAAPDINNSSNNARTTKSTYLLEAHFSKIVPAQNIADAACSLNDEQNFDAIINKEESIASCAVVLPHNGIHHIEMKLCDDNNLCNTRGHNVLFDDEPPVITPINEQESYQRNVSVSFLISDTTSSILQPVTWTAIGNGETMSGVAQQLPVEGTYQVFFDAARFGNSPVRLTIKTRDSLKNMATRSQTYQVFNQPPTVLLVSTPKFNQDIYNTIFEVEENSYTNIKVWCRLAPSIIFQVGTYQKAQSSNQQSEQTLKARGECIIVSSEIQDGNHTLEIKICGDYNLCVTQPIIITKDTAAPMIRKINLQDEYDGAGGQVILEITDELSMVTSATFAIDDNEAQDITKRTSDWTFALPLNFNTGRHKLTIVTADEVGNSDTMHYNFLTLREEPIISRVSSSFTKDVTYRLAAQLDPGSYQGIYQAQCILVEQSIAASISRNRINCPLDTSGLNDGEHLVKIILATDYDKSYTREISFIKDTTAPQISILNLQDEYDGVGGQVILEITDELSMVTSATFTINDNEAQDITKRTNDWTFALPLNLNTGRHKLTIVTVDEVGNSDTMQHDFLTLREEPIISRTSALYTDSNLYRLAAQLDPGSYQGDYQAQCILAEQSVVASISGDRINCSLDTQGLNDGEYQVEITIETDYDKSYTREISFIKDTTPPQINILDLLAAYTSPVPTSLQVDINDELSPTTRATYRINEGDIIQLADTGAKIIILPINELPTGRHTLTIQATDLIGNTDTMTHNFIVEKDAPIVTQTSAQATNQGIYNLVATLDKGSYQGDYNAECQINDQVASATISGDTLKCLLDISSSSDNNYDIQITLTADYGKSYTREISFIKDTTAPQISILNLQDEYDGVGGQVILEITDELSMVTSATFTINDNEAQDITKRANDWTFALPLNLNTGKHKLTIVTVDEVGNTNSIQHNFLTLREEPIISRTSSLFTKDDTYRLAVQLQPGSYQGVYQAQCILAEQSVVASIFRNRINCPLDTQGLNDGEYQVEIILATDYDKSYTRKISFIKDATPPQINILDLLAAYTNPVPSTLQVDINDELSPTVMATYRINEGDDMQLADTGVRRIITLPINELPTGRHTLIIQATDFIGNTDTITRNFVVEKDAPIVTQTSAQTTNQGTYNLVATLDKGSYQGDYNAECQINNQVVSATISGNTLRCLLDISSSSDNNYDIQVTLTADYGKSYTREISFIKDTTPPQINILNLLAAYTSHVPTSLQVNINDELSPTVMATYRINEGDVMQLADTGTRRIITLPINELPTGRHTLIIQATDFIGNTDTVTRNFIVEKDAPIVTQTSAQTTNQGTYNLVATLDKGSYQGDYNAECQLNDQVVSAVINGNTLKCLLDISSSSDNNYDIQVTLTADYGKSYTQTLTVIKDTTPPQIIAIEHQQAYSATPFTLRYQVSDLLSDISSVTYLYGDNTQGLSARPIGNNLWEADINPNVLLSGEHNVRVIVSDALSNSLQINSPILIIKYPPEVTLAHQNVSNKDTMDIIGEIILTTPEASVASITCSFLRNPNDAITEGINGEINGNNFVCRSLPIVGLNNELVEVQICDIFANCATYPTFVTHDNSPPILSSVAMPDMVNVYSCGEKNRYDDIPPNCSITQSPATNIYSISEQEQDLQKNNPPLIVVQQEATSLNNASIVINNFTDSAPNNELMVSEISINRNELDRRGVIFAGINVHDNELSPSRYFTNPYDLNMTYSYTQIDCPADDTGDQNSTCSHNKKKVYFTKMPIPQAAINVNTDSNDAEITIPFSNELLSSGNKPLWYSAPPRTIHRLDIFICDEAGNCVQYVTRFRVIVLAATPIVTFNINNNFRNDFQRNDNLHYLYVAIQRNVRTWRVSNPSPTDMWVKIEQSPADIQYLAKIWKMRKINRYYIHYLLQSSRRDGSCNRGSQSFPRYRFVTKRLTLAINGYNSTPEPLGPRFTAPNLPSYPLPCGINTPPRNRVRHEQINGYPRQELTRDSSSDKKINFAMTLNRHLVNLAKGTKTPALEYNNWILLPAGDSLLLTTDEKMTGSPGDYQTIMVYDNWRNIDRYRNVIIPASIELSYTRSQVESVSPSLSSVRSRIYPIPKVIVNNQRVIYCAKADGESDC